MPKAVLITGGAGFIGSNLARTLIEDGYSVTVLDSLARPGSNHNLRWLRDRDANGNLNCIVGDVRDESVVRTAAQGADIIYHIAAQVAVTTSVSDPRADFEVNALGTLNVLEAARLSNNKPIVIFTSTNKVYGGMDDVAVVEKEGRYEFRDCPQGMSESRPLDFHSPYGCSKGAGDQYVHDYARIYGLPTVVFRMSCIYGPRQFGTEDQGWLAHFMIAALTGKPITIYGDGKQVRDVLFVDDLVRAFRLTAEKIDRTAGEVFNIGGGPANSLAVWTEFSEVLAELKGKPVRAAFANWRPGDQPCYVTDIQKARNVMGWEPVIDKLTGMHRLWAWLSGNRQLFETREERALAGGAQ